MNERLYIDGVDVYTTYGVYVVEGGWNDLVAFPPLKDYESNDWHEEDGIEADLSAPVLDTRDASVKFAFGTPAKLMAFVETLADGAYHEFNCASIGRSYKLRMTEHTNLVLANLLGSVTIKFADDFPLADYTYSAPYSTVDECDDYQIDGVNTTDYGVRVLQGSLANILQVSNVKENMLREIDTVAGATYDGETVTYEEKDVKLNCLMRAETLTELWNNWDALLYNLSQPEERQLYVSSLDKTFPCCYKECAVSSFYPEDKIWLEFSLTLTFLSDFRITT